MRQIVLEAVQHALLRNSGNRSQSARELRISIRTMRNYIQEMKDQGVAVPASKHWWIALKENAGKAEALVTTVLPKYCRHCGKLG